MLNMWIAVLIEKGILDVEEGKALAEKIAHSTLPGDFNSAHALIKKIFVQIEKER